MPFELNAFSSDEPSAPPLQPGDLKNTKSLEYTEPFKFTQPKFSPSVSLQIIPWTELKLINFEKKSSNNYETTYAGRWLGTKVTIKELNIGNLSVDLQEEFKKKFAQEIETLSRSHFPILIRLLGVCLEKNHYAMVMEYMPEETLYSVLHASKKQLPWPLRIKLAKKIGNALTYLHNIHTPHGNLTSHTILLDKEMHPKLINFGSKSSTEGIIVRWCAPELFESNIQSKQSDFAAAVARDAYSFGMILWELASSRIPFVHAPDATTIINCLKDGKQEKIPTDCPLAFRTIIEACLLRTAKERLTPAQVVELLNSTKAIITTQLSNTSLKVIPQTNNPVQGESEYQAGMDFYNQRSYQKALLHFEKAFSLEYWAACLWLGKIKKEKSTYYYKVAAEQLDWFNQQAAAGSIQISTCLGICYISGKIFAVDVKKGLDYLKTSAEKYEDPNAYYEIGVYLWENSFNNETQAVKTIKKLEGLIHLQEAARRDHPNAQCLLGRIYSVDTNELFNDSTKSAEYYLLAANHGIQVARHNIAVRYYNGKGIIENKPKAIEYFWLLIKEGKKDSKSHLREILKEMSQTETSYISGTNPNKDDYLALQGYWDQYEKGNMAAEEKIEALIKKLNAPKLTNNTLSEFFKPASNQSTPSGKEPSNLKY